METKEFVKKSMNGAVKKDHSEGRVAKEIENQTAKLPSDLFLWSAMGCLSAAAVMMAVNVKHWSLLVGQLAAPLLIMGLYNKVVKVEGHDKYDKHAV